MTRPLKQIDDEIREMTEEEYAIYLERLNDGPKIETDETPSPA